MKKYLISAFLVVILSLSLVVTAFAADATALTGGLYYTSGYGFGGGSHSTGVISVSSSTLTGYYNTLRNSTATNVSVYTFSYEDVGNARYIQVKKGGTYMGRVCNSSGSVYVYYTSSGSSISNPSSGADNSDILNSINSKLWATYDNSQLDIASLTRNILTRLDTLYNMLWSTYDGTPTDIAVLVRKSLQRLDTIADRTYATYNGDNTQHGIGWIQMRTLERLDTIISYLWSTYEGNRTEIGVINRRILENTDVLVDKFDNIGTGTNIDVTVPITNIDNNLVLKFDSLIGEVRKLQNYDDSNVRSSIGGVEHAVTSFDTHVTRYLRDEIITNQLIEQSSLDSIDGKLSNIIDNQRNYTYTGFSILFDPFMEQLVSQNDTIIDAISNLDVSGGSAVTTGNNPYVRKIYNVLYDGAGGSSSDIVDIASEQLGVTEGKEYYTWYGFDSHVEWCAVFVSWCAEQCGFLDDIIPKFAVVDDGADWFKSRSLWLDGGQLEVIPGIETKTITPVRITDNGHNYVTIYVDIAEDGTLTASGAGKNGGKFYNPEIVPSVADFSGNQTVTVYWGGSASAYRGDSRQVRLVYDVNTVTTGGGVSDVVVGASEPSPGDIIFFDWDVDHDPDHVGIVADYADGIVTTIEGNTGDSPGVVSSRTISYDSPLIYGYGTPEYPSGGGASIYSVLVDISNKLGRSSVVGVSSYDDTVLLSKLTDIEEALNGLGDNVVVSIDNVTNVDIPLDNDAHDVFYVTDDDGDKSIVDLSGNSVKIVGKLMNFLYQAMFKDALNDADSSIQGLYDFYLDNSEGVDVWDS